MTNRDRLNALSNAELGRELCKIMEDIVADNYFTDDMDLPITSGCDICPMRNRCSKGNSGFEAYLNQEVEDED